ncbi:MAG: oxaloacetate decarboxylase subunit alpha, partial [Fusobacteriaceae bacterium]
ASMLYLRAIDAGVDIIDTAISPFSGGTSQPATEALARTLAGGERDPGLNMELLKEIAEYFKPIREKYIKDGTLNPQALFTEPSILEYQLPGGMLSNLVSQLTAQKAADKYEEVLREIPRVREDLGFPPLVTPLSQMVGTQAVFNVLSKERYKLVPKEIKDYVKGLYGKSPAKISDEITKKIIGNDPVFTGRPADLLEPELEKLKQEIGDLAHSEEEVLIYGMFPQIARTYLEGKYAPPKAEIKIQTINIVF